jgi:hypothetical protein
MSYNLDPNAARKADQGGNRITDIGKYVGVFTQAVDITASTGTKGIALRFDSNGQGANLSLYTMRANGDQLMGYQALMAIMTCMKVRNIEVRPGTFKQWDAEAKQEVTQRGEVYPDLCNKPIGLLLETEDYPKNDGGTGSRMVIAGIFQPETEFTASEILDKKTQPEQLEKMVARLRHRPMKAAKSATPAATGAGGGSGFDDMDDDIPFVSASMQYDMEPSKSRRMRSYDY